MGITNYKGNIAELKVALICAKNHWVPSFPYGEETAYDMIVDTNKELLKVQVKYITPTKNNSILQIKFICNGMSSYKNSVDIMAIYCPTNDSVYWIDLRKHKFPSKTQITLRLLPTKNNQKLKTYNADDFLMRI